MSLCLRGLPGSPGGGGAGLSQAGLLEDLHDVGDVLNYHQTDFARQTDDPSIQASPPHLPRPPSQRSCPRPVQEELAAALGTVGSEFGPDVFGEPGAAGDGDDFFGAGGALLDPPLRRRHPTAPSALGTLQRKATQDSFCEQWL